MAELIAFIGGGQMARSLAGGLLAAGHPAARLRVAEPDASRAAALRRDFGVEVLARGADVAPGADALVLAVKPQSMREALAGVAPPASTTVISIAAGLDTATLRRWLGAGAPLVRAMPNTPARSRNLAERILGAVGSTCWIAEESQMDAVTALSGAGPAYFFLVAEALREAGAALGLEASTAALLAQKTLAGAGRMADGPADVSDLRANVTSRGGVTEAAVAQLERDGLRALFASAVRAAAVRGRELGDTLSN